MCFDMKTTESSRRARAVSMETGGLPLVSTFALLTIVAGQLQGSGYSEQEPEFLSPLENLTVAQGRDIHFTCTVNHLGTFKEVVQGADGQNETRTYNLSDFRVAWIKSDTKTILAIHTHMVTLNPRLSVTHNGHNTWMLYISNVEPKDSGTYMCQINTDPMMSQMGHLSVVIPPDIADEDGSEARASEGGSVELRCTATGVPEPIISWRRTAGRNIEFRDDNGKVYKVMESYVGSTLSLKGLQRADMGTYLCIAANGIPPTKSRRYEVSVQFQPLVRVVRPVVFQAAEMQVRLQCYIEASPRSLNTWHRKSQAGGKLLNGSKYIISEEVINEYALHMNLTITRLKKSDFGEYSCSAVNGYGKADGTVTLKETPQRTTTTTTTTTTTSTTPRPTTTTQTTTRPPKRHPKKQQDRVINAIDADLRQAELNVNNYYNVNAYGPTNNTHNEYAQRTERQKVRPSGPPRHYINYNKGTKSTLSLISFTVFLVKLAV